MVARIPFKRPKPAHDMNVVRQVSVEAYKKRLGEDSVRRMLKKDADDGSKLRERAGAYDPMTRAYLTVLSDMGFILKDWKDG